MLKSTDLYQIDLCIEVCVKSNLYVGPVIFPQYLTLQ